MKKSILITIAAILVIAGITYLLLMQSKPLEVPMSGVDNISEPEAGTSTNSGPEASIVVKTYPDPGQTFEIDYPDFYLVSAPMQASSNYGTVPHSVNIESPEQERAGTNLLQSAVFVGYSKTAQDVRLCAVVRNGETKLGSITVSGNEFNIFTYDGIAAGNQYQTVRYRTVKNQTCFEAVLLMHSGNIGNYPAGTVKEFDRAATLERLKAIFYSLRLK